MLSRSVLMNDFLESFLLVFGENKYTNTKDIEQLFVIKQIIVPKNSKYYNFGYNSYKALIKHIYQKLQVRHFRRSRKTLKYENCLNFEKLPFDVLVVHDTFQVCCV